MQTKMRHFLPLVAALAMCGCSKEEPQAADPYDKPYSRIQDPEYVKALAASNQERKALMTELARVSEELRVETEKDPESARTKELRKEMARVSEKALQQRILTQALVRDRINRETKAVAEREAREGRNANDVTQAMEMVKKNLKKGNN